MTQENLLSQVPIPEGQIHRIVAENPDHEAAADAYATTLRQIFALADGEFPRFDLIHLGLGTEGHTASLFPGSPALAERERLVAAPWVEKLDSLSDHADPADDQRGARGAIPGGGRGEGRHRAGDPARPA